MERIATKGANIVVATPGRLFDLIGKKALDFKKLEMLILDEADKLLDNNNALKMQTVLEQLPKLRRTGLFSATMPSQVKNLIKTGMRNPYVVEVKTEDQGIFATKTQSSDAVTVKAFDTFDRSSAATFDEQINNISEIP